MLLCGGVRYNAPTDVHNVNTCSSFQNHFHYTEELATVTMPMAVLVFIVTELHTTEQRSYGVLCRVLYSLLLTVSMLSAV